MSVLHAVLWCSTLQETSVGWASGSIFPSHKEERTPQWQGLNLDPFSRRSVISNQHTTEESDLFNSLAILDFYEKNKVWLKHPLLFYYASFS